MLIPKGGDVAMGIQFYLKLYAVTVPVFFAIDMLWLGIVARTLYQNSLGHLLSPEVNWTAAVGFYLLYIAGILIFAVVPAIERGSMSYAVMYGGLFGFFTYATYDLTNLATLREWPLKVVLIDVAWGVVLCSAVAAVSFSIGKRFL
jgi:uncharacterized membrane protein